MENEKIMIPVDDVITMMYRLISSFIDPYSKRATTLIKIELQRLGYLPKENAKSK